MLVWHHADKLNRMYINIGDGKKAAMPRYYKNKIYSDEQRKEISGYQKGKIEAETIQAIWRYEGNSSYARDQQQAIFAAARKFKFQNQSRQKL